jgi:hypothetical protein
MYLTKSADEARKLVLSIPHTTCTRAIDENWKVANNGRIRAQSVLWLYCWAKTGMGSEPALRGSVRVFNEVLPIRFVDFDAIPGIHEYARRQRYASGDIEHDFERLIAPSVVTLKPATCGRGKTGHSGAVQTR